MNFVTHSGLRGCDAPKECGPSKALCNGWKRWRDKGLARIMMGLAAKSTGHKKIMIDATCLKAHRTATSLQVKKGAWTPDRSNKGEMSVKLHAVTDTHVSLIRFLMTARGRSVIALALRHCRAACPRPTGFWPGP